MVQTLELLVNLTHECLFVLQGSWKKQKGNSLRCPELMTSKYELFVALSVKVVLWPDTLNLLHTPKLVKTLIFGYF